MADSRPPAVRAARAEALPSVQFLDTAFTQLEALHTELLALVETVALVEERDDGSQSSLVTLRPSPTQAQTANVLLKRYQRWLQGLRPFLERSPTAPTAALDQSFAVLCSYFSLRRVGSQISNELWRELFALESKRLVTEQLGLLEAARECFALLDPRPRKPLEDLFLRFVPLAERRFRVFAQSERGEVDDEVTLPFDDRDVENFVLRHCGPVRGSVRGWTPSSVQPYADFGGRLFNAVFSGAVRDLYMQHAAVVAAGEVGLRLRLKLGAVPLLASVPWEYLYTGTDFLALTGAVSITRHVDAQGPVRPLRVDGPLRIAVTVSAPSDQANIDASAEVSALKTALAPLIAAGRVAIDVAPDGSIATLSKMLRTAEVAGNPYHGWHFIGHARFLDSEGAPFLAFESTNGTTRLHSGFEVAVLLAAYPGLRIAVLNACEAARAAPEDSLTSVGAALVARGLPAVVAMQFSITDAAAICFAEDFYRGVADGRSVDTAVADARRAIFFIPNESEWATPVIISRAEDGELFDFMAGAGNVVGDPD